MAPSSPDTPGAIALTVPFHAGKRIAVNQTARASGHDLTLDQLVITRSETVIYLHTDGAVYGGDLRVNGQRYVSETGLKLLAGSRESGIIYDPINTLVSPSSAPTAPSASFWTLEGATGTWTLTVSELSDRAGQTVTGTWQFTFTVS
jgi:hypothetical protein